jgi:hypothetical protein
LLKHLEHTGRVLVEKIGGPTSSDENTVIKFMGKKADGDEAKISQKELALFSLQQ